MFYIHQSSCISPQPTFNGVNLDELRLSVNNVMYAIEPVYQGIPEGHLRRMGKTVRMGVGAGIPLLLQNKIHGIIIGTANGGIDDSIKFLNQLIEYQEGRLTPTNFVQSTYNAMAGMMGMITENRGYNITHVHRGMAFETAVLDAAMMLSENTENNYLLGGVDEISVRNYPIESLDGWFKEESMLNGQLFEVDSVGTLPGEGAAMFVVNNSNKNATAHLRSLKMLNTFDEILVPSELNLFLKENNIEVSDIDLLLTGENGDNRLLKYYTACEAAMDKNTPVARFKHLTGEFQTASALALWFACHILQTQLLPPLMLKKNAPLKEFRNILIYNNYKGGQHSFMLVERAEQ